MSVKPPNSLPLFKARAQKQNGHKFGSLTELLLFASMNTYGGNHDPKGT
jgi:hypothetical protein